MTNEDLSQAEFSPWPLTTREAMTTEELHALVRKLQEHTPLELISNMQARTVFEWMLQKGYSIHKPKENE